MLPLTEHACKKISQNGETKQGLIFQYPHTSIHEVVMTVVINYAMTIKKYLAKVVNIPFLFKFHYMILHHIEIINNRICGDLHCNLIKKII